LPAIREQAQFAFRAVPSEAREELVQEVVAQAYGLFVRLAQRRKLALAYATPLARFAIRKVGMGVRFGSRCNRRDLTSPCAGLPKKLSIERLDRLNRQTDKWREILLEDHTAGPAETVAARLDFDAWLKTLSRRDRQLAESLAVGETTGRAARIFRISAARVSQLRRELCESWHKFVSDIADSDVPCVATA
jgi:hypothetical protein